MSLGTRASKPAGRRARTPERCPAGTRLPTNDSDDEVRAGRRRGADQCVPRGPPPLRPRASPQTYRRIRCRARRPSGRRRGPSSVASRATITTGRAAAGSRERRPRLECERRGRGRPVPRVSTSTGAGTRYIRAVLVRATKTAPRRRRSPGHHDEQLRADHTVAPTEGAELRRAPRGINCSRMRVAVNRVVEPSNATCDACR